MSPLPVPDIVQLRELLGRSKADPAVAQLRFRCRVDDDEDVHLGAAHWSDSQAGFSVRISEKGTVDTIFLYGMGTDGFAQYPGRLDDSVEFGMTSEQIRTRSGEPSRAAPPGKTMLGAHGGWDRYDYPAYSVHYAYRHADRRMHLVTMMHRSTGGE